MLKGCVKIRNRLKPNDNALNKQRVRELTADLHTTVSLILLTRDTKQPLLFCIILLYLLMFHSFLLYFTSLPGNKLYFLFAWRKLQDSIFIRRTFIVK